MSRSRAAVIASAAEMGAPATRPLPEWVRRAPRFAGVSLMAGAAQIGLLAVLLRVGWAPLPANILAFAVATQVSFLLSQIVTWHDRVAGGALAIGPWRRWARYNGAIALTALLNQGIFFALSSWMSPLFAAALASSLVALLNFAVINRFVFAGTRRARPVARG